MKDFRDRRIWMLLACIVILVLVMAALVTVPPFSFIRGVEIDSDLPYSLERKASRVEGLSRLGSDYRRLKHEFEDSMYLQDVSFKAEGGVVHIAAEPDGETVALTDGKSYLLYGNGESAIPLPEDIAFLLRHMPLVEVSTGQLEYIGRYGIEKQLSEVIDLILEIYHSSSYNGKLTGRVKFQGGTGDEFGHLAISTTSGDAVLHIREKADPKRVIDSLVMMNDKARVLPEEEIREYELRGNKLLELKRIVDGI